MIYSATVTSQGQITIPAIIRRGLGLKKLQKVILTLKDNFVIMEPEPNIMQLSGSLHQYALQNKSIEEIIGIEKAAAADAVAESYQKKI
jgi:AbrB family looped-hinge helix DNA binding protein